MKRFSAWVVAASLGAASIGLTAPVAWAETVKVGMVSPFSGGFAIWGQQFQEAIETFQIVHGTSVNGNEVEIIYRDSGGPDPAKSRQVSEELVLRDKVQYLAGYTFTPNALSVADLITEAEIPAVIMNAGTAIITRQSPFFVRVSMTLPQQTAPMAEWAAANEIKTVYTLVSDYAPGHDAEQQFINTFTAAGGEIINSVRAPLSTTDFAPYMERISQAEPDGIFIFMPAGPPSIAAIQSWDQRGLKEAGIAMMGTGETQEVFLPAIGNAGVGVLSSLQYGASLNNPANVEFVAKMREVHGEDTIPDIASVAAWDGMTLIYDAIAELGPDASGADIIEFMKGRELDSPRGPIMIDPETRDIVQNLYIRRVGVKDGSLVNQVIDTIEAVKDPWKIANPE